MRKTLASVVWREKVALGEKVASGEKGLYFEEENGYRAA